MEINTNLFEDPVITCITDFLKEQLNIYGQEIAQLDLVNGTRTYQSFNVGLHEFPLLRVYRVREDFVPECNKSESFINVDYCLSYPENENLSSVVNVITKYIHRLINRLESQINLGVNQRRTRSVGYKIIGGANSQPIYAVITYTFSIIEGT